MQLCYATFSLHVSPEFCVSLINNYSLLVRACVLRYPFNFLFSGSREVILSILFCITLYVLQ